MRKELLDLIQSTIVFQFDLPNTTHGIGKTIYSTESDSCYMSSSDEGLCDIIYNSIVEYSFNDHEISAGQYANLHARALKTKIRYNEAADEAAKIKYGFFGEVLLHCILAVKYNAVPLIARGYFYNPLEGAETKGYDSYELVDNAGRTELWFGEAKFYRDYKAAVKVIFNNIHKSLCDSYLSKNILALVNHKNNFNVAGTQIEEIINAWESNPDIKIVDEVQKYNMKLVYPILLIYQGGEVAYEESIKEVIKHIEDDYTVSAFGLSVDVSVFFIMIPLKDVKSIKQSVIEWIESKRPLV